MKSLRASLCTAFTMSVFAIVLISPLASAQNVALLTIANQTGDRYGITAWRNWGTQTNAESLGRDDDVPGYGINIKYGSLSFGCRHAEYVEKHIPIYKFNPATNKCIRDTNIVCSIDTTPVARISFALGYLSYSEIESTLPDFKSSFDVNGAYAGIYLSIPIDNGGAFSAVLGYTGSMVSVEDVNGIYTRKDTNGIEVEVPVKMKFPSTPIHEFNYGLSVRLSQLIPEIEGVTLFFEGTTQNFRVTNASFTSVDTTIPNGEVQKKLEADMDLSFKSFKAGVSLSF